MNATTTLTTPTWEKYTVMSHVIYNMDSKDRRRIFLNARKAPVPSPDLFFPKHGFTLAEFALWYLVGESSETPSQKKYASV